MLAAIAFGFLALVARPSNGAVAQTIAHSIAYVALANAVLAVFNVIPAFPR